MASQPNRPLKIEVRLKSDHPKLLIGLDEWLRLGLISEAQLKRLSRDYLTCPMPQPSVVVPDVKAPESDPRAADFALEEVTPPAETQQRRSLLQQLGRSFKDELSVRWLLFLGVFLVVVSSGVLAATQWQNFPAAGQYGVLWAYTIIFWMGSFWAGKQRNLQLTAQTLRLITLLLVPVNFWAMDSFGLWHYPWEWGVVAIAAFTLSAVTILHPAMRSNTSRLTSFASLLLWLSYLHWGWHWSQVPLVAVYLGIVGTAIFLPGGYRNAVSLPALPQTEETGTQPEAEALTPSWQTIQSDPRTGSSIVIYALTVLLGRAIFAVQLPIAQLGLAIGICGWLFARLGHPPATTSESNSFQSKIWETLGGCLLLIGWLVSVGETVPWQATVVSGLGLWFFANRLQRFWLRRDLLAIFLILLQTHQLLKRLVPPVVQQGIIGYFTQLTHATSAPWSLSGLGLFPDLLVMVVLVDWLHRISKPKLAVFGEQLIFCFGLVLVLISLANPTARSLDLLFSTLTLVVVTYRWSPVRTDLAYCTHITGLLTLGSAIDWQFPNLSLPIWVSILLVGMMVEWGYSIFPAPVRLTSPPMPPQSLGGTGFQSPPSLGDLGGEKDLGIHGSLAGEGSETPAFPAREQRGLGQSEPNRRRVVPQSSIWPSIWQRSAWHLGFGLSGLSYTLLWSQAYPTGFTNSPGIQETGLLWLLTPLALTAVAGFTSEPRRQEASWLSVVALGMIQLLTIWIPGVRLISLGFATGLMLVNTRYLRQKTAAVITIGFGLSFMGMLLWEGIPGLSRLSVPNWFLAGAIAICGLWLLRSLLRQRPGTVAALYAEASDSWAVALCGVELVMLTLVCLGSYLELNPTSWQYLIASTLVLGAIIYRCWQHPTNTVVYSLSWAAELVIAESILLSGGSALELATANIILGLVTLFVSDWWLVQQRRPIPLGSVEILPLLYALLGLGLRIGEFSSWTGLLTLGAALTGIGIGRRQQEWKPLTYLSLAGISIAWYELVIYQMLQAEGGSPADAFTVLAAVAVAVAFIYRLLAWFWQSRSEQLLLNLSVAEITITAHLHWGLASSLMVLAATISVDTEPRLAGLGIVLCLMLVAYALVQGRQNSNASDADAWVYIGCTELVATVFYARLIWAELSGLDAWFAIIACVLAYGMYELPWHNWGWPRTPWRHSAVLLPVFTVLVTANFVSNLSLLLVAGFYAWIAKRRRNLRFTYISVVLIDWAIARWFERLNLTDPLWYATLLGLSLLYIAQFDPGLKQPEQREARHYLRILGSGVICLVALLWHQETGLIPGIIGTITIFAGLLLRVRAFLFVGTATFLLTAFYQLVILISRYPFVKWVVGLIAGIIFIGMAANFENRREQITFVLRNRWNELDAWE